MVCSWIIRVVLDKWSEFVREILVNDLIYTSKEKSFLRNILLRICRTQKVSRKNLPQLKFVRDRNAAKNIRKGHKDLI